MRLHRDRLEADGIHEALDAHVHQLNVAVGDRDNPDAMEGQLPEEPCQVRMISRQSIQRFQHEDFEFACLGCGEELPQPGTRRGGAAHRGVAVDGGQLVSTLLNEPAADTDLILNRGGILLIRRVAAVDRSPIAILRSHFRPQC